MNKCHGIVRKEGFVLVFSYKINDEIGEYVGAVVIFIGLQQLSVLHNTRIPIARTPGPGVVP